jgi:DNA replication protein DnaD
MHVPLWFIKQRANMAEQVVALEHAEEQIMNQIYTVRGQRVMLDRDLATLYEVETKVLKQAVKRNLERFPPDFMFTLSKAEAEEISRSQSVTLKQGQNLKYLPAAFTEQGVAMLSGVLNSKRAIQVNIQIMRLFTRLRSMLANHAELRLEIEQIKKKLGSHAQNIELVFHYLDELIEKGKEEAPRRQIGYQVRT